MAAITVPSDLRQHMGLRFGKNVSVALNSAHCAVKKGATDNDVIHTAAITDIPWGFVDQVSPDSTAPVALDQVDVLGPGNIVMCTAGGTCSAGSYAEAGANGRVVNMTTGNICGIFMSTAASGELVAVQVTIAPT